MHLLSYVESMYSMWPCSLQSPKSGTMNGAMERIINPNHFCTVYGFSDSEGGPLYDLTLAEGSTVDITFGALKNEAEGRRFIEISSTPLPGTSECSCGACSV